MGSSSHLSPSTHAKPQLRVLSLFAGIGGFDLGLERTGGFKTVAFCEIDPFCRRVLAKHWPEVPIVRDIRSLDREQVAAVGPVDVVCGGFPCQDVSQARRGTDAAGLDGDRSGLWVELVRIVDLARPGWVLVENVHRLATAGVDRVITALEALGYACETLIVGAGNAGAPHLRQRLWLVAHAAGERRGEVPRHVAQAAGIGAGAGHVASVAEAERPRWADEPNVCRVAHGLPNRVDRLRTLGNAVVPQIPELIGRAILEAEACA
jgi:DNA (cytosine-5)-methyltransferase 1